MFETYKILHKLFQISRIHWTSCLNLTKDTIQYIIYWFRLSWSVKWWWPSDLTGHSPIFLVPWPFASRNGCHLLRQRNKVGSPLYWNHYGLKWKASGENQFKHDLQTYKKKKSKKLFDPQRMAEIHFHHQNISYIVWLQKDILWNYKTYY